MVSFKPKWENILGTAIVFAFLALIPIIPVMTQPVCTSYEQACPSKYNTISFYQTWDNRYVASEATLLTALVIILELVIAYYASCIIVGKLDPGSSKR